MYPILQIYGLDFRDLSRLEAFCCHLEQTYDRLDVIINNAAQTVRRPPAYYAHLMEAERTNFFLTDGSAAAASSASSSSCHASQEASTATETTSTSASITARMKQSLRGQHHFNTSQSAGVGVRASLGDIDTVAPPTQARSVQRSTSAGHRFSSAEMSQLPLIASEENDTCSFPTALTDVNGQQVDLRRQNSWTMKLHEVPTVELAEVFAINTIAPTIINARLKNLMLRRPTEATDGPGDRHGGRNKKGKGTSACNRPEQWRFIVNVSAMEGKFYRYKGENHPHTNMAKAALNMMTRTSAQDYVKSGIYMTAVDTGWINDEKPIDLAMAHEKTHNFQTPLDEVDAASRVLDPVIAPLRAAQDLLSQGVAAGGADSTSIVEPPWGYFLKDYVKTEW